MTWPPAPAALFVFLAALAVLVSLVCGPAAVDGAAAGRSVMLPEPTFTGAAPTAALGLRAAPQPGSGGWYWPVGTEDFQGWDSWLQPRGSYVHVAQDMPTSVGHAVYAIAAGVVYISRADAGGYGVNATPGGCIIITHVTAAGTSFHALYGHVYDLRVKAGQHVSPGQVIARVNGCKHLHFSVHPGTKYRDGNPYAGHVPASWADHGGFVDPVKFLRTNPRTADYVPPALPVVQILTAVPPLQYGAADGAAYWTEEGEAGTVRWRQDLGTGQRAALSPGEAPPPFDTGRYDVALLSPPAVGFSVGDHRPMPDLKAAHATPAWGVDAELTARLTNAAGKPLQGALLKLQRLAGDTWGTVSRDITGADGTAELLFMPSASTSLRVAFVPPATQPADRTYLPARSRTEVVTPHVALTTPRAPATVAHDAMLTAWGDLTPAHAAGRCSVHLVFQRRDDQGQWETRLTVDAVNRVVDGLAATRYVGHAYLSRGAWRVQAVHAADKAHAATMSGWRRLTVE